MDWVSFRRVAFQQSFSFEDMGGTAAWKKDANGIETVLPSAKQQHGISRGGKSVESGRRDAV